MLAGELERNAVMRVIGASEISSEYGFSHTDIPLNLKLTEPVQGMRYKEVQWSAKFHAAPQHSKRGGASRMCGLHAARDKKEELLMLHTEHGCVLGELHHSHTSISWGTSG